MSFRSLTPILLTGFVSLTICVASSPAVMSEEKNCAADADKELSLPTGFCATIFADKVGHARQLAVAPDGTVYVNTWSGVYYGNDTPPAGGFLIALKDTKGTGHAERTSVWSDCCGGRARRYGYLALQELALRRDR